MTYRDDRDADQLRIEALELELARAKTRIAELEGQPSTALAVQPGGALALLGQTRGARVFGGPREIVLTRRWDRAFPTAQLEDLIEVIRGIAGEPGRSELLRSSLTWYPSRADKSGGALRVLAVSVRDGATTLTCSDRLGAWAGAVYGGFGSGVGLGGLLVPISASAAVPVLAPVFFLGWFGGVFVGARAIYRHIVRKRAVELQRLFDALGAAIERSLPAAATAT